MALKKFLRAPSLWSVSLSFRREVAVAVHYLPFLRDCHWLHVRNSGPWACLMRFLLFPVSFIIWAWPLASSAPAASHLVPPIRKPKQSWTYSWLLCLDTWLFSLDSSPTSLALREWENEISVNSGLQCHPFWDLSESAFLVFHLLLTFNLTGTCLSIYMTSSIWAPGPYDCVFIRFLYFQYLA